MNFLLVPWAVKKAIYTTVHSCYLHKQKKKKRKEKFLDPCSLPTTKSVRQNAVQLYGGTYKTNNLIHKFSLALGIFFPLW